MGTLDVEDSKLTTGPVEVFDPASLGFPPATRLASLTGPPLVMPLLG